MTVRTTQYPVLALVAFATIAVAGCSLVATDPTAGSVIRTGLEAQDVPSPYALVRTWNIDGNWGDVDIDVRTGAIYALRDVSWDQANERWTANVSRIGPTGQVENEVDIGGKKDPPTMLKVFRSGRDGDPAFLTSDVWQDMVYVRKSDGAPWWNQAFPDVQAIRIADLEGDGTDEVLVATLRGGLWAQSSSGQLLWRVMEDESVHCVAFVPRHGDSAASVVARYSGSSVAFLDTQGQLIRTTRPPIPFSDAESRLAGADTWEILGAESQPPKLLAMSADGTVLWRAVDGDKELRRVYMAEMAVTADGRWVALAMKGGIVRVYDASNGRCVASARVPFGGYPAAVWTQSQDGAAPCIIMASAAGLQALELRLDEAEVDSTKPGANLPSNPNPVQPE